MKKHFLLISILILSSCNKEIPFRLDEEYYGSPKLIELNSLKEFKDLEKENKSFGIYVYLPGCLSCSKFKPILEEYINQKQIQLYSISYLEIKNSINILTSKIKYTPAVALFSKGDLVAFLDSNNTDHTEYFESVEGLSDWFNQYIETI